MIDTRGNKTVIVDSDALIGLIHRDDILHRRCLRVAEYLSRYSFTTIVPYPIVLESATTLARAKTINRPDLADQLLKDYAHLTTPSVEDSEVSKTVAKLYDPKTSKKNTPFDFYVLATAKISGIKIVFSFDSFYKKHGLKLAEELTK